MKRRLFPIAGVACPEAGAVLARAFRDDPVTCAVLRDLSPSERLRRLIPAFSILLEASLERSRPLGVWEGRRIVGVSLAHPPGAYPLPLTAQVMMILRTSRRSGLYGLGRWMRWLRGIDRMHPRSPYHYLEHLGVEPALQGQRIGSMLLEALTKRADSEGLPCFLETANAANLPLYERFDFRIVDEAQIIGVHTWFMRREHRRR